MPTAEMQDKQETPALSGIVALAGALIPVAAGHGAFRRGWEKIKRLPRWAHIASVAFILLISLVSVYVFFPSGPADLRVTVQHSFRSIQISVVMDGNVVYKGTANGASKKRFGWFDKSGSSGNFSTVLHVPSGRHAMQVHVSAPAEGFDQAKVAYAELTDQQENVLVVGAGRRAGLSLTFQGGAVAKAAVESDSKSNRSAFSVLFSVIGTMLSASISFLVQEFWRTHKNRMASSQSVK